MKVLNAVPLTATASRKATAFSLIIRMFWFPVLLFGSPDDQRGERGSPGPEHHIHSRAQFSISQEI